MFFNLVFGLQIVFCLPTKIRYWIFFEYNKYKFSLDDIPIYPESIDRFRLYPNEESFTTNVFDMLNYFTIDFDDKKIAAIQQLVKKHDIRDVPGPYLFVLKLYHNILSADQISDLKKRNVVVSGVKTPQGQPVCLIDIKKSKVTLDELLGNIRKTKANEYIMGGSDTEDKFLTRVAAFLLCRRSAADSFGFFYDECKKIPNRFIFNQFEGNCFPEDQITYNSGYSDADDSELDEDLEEEDDINPKGTDEKREGSTDSEKSTIPDEDINKDFEKTFEGKTEEAKSTESEKSTPIDEDIKADAAKDPKDGPKKDPKNDERNFEPVAFACTWTIIILMVLFART